MFAKFDRVLTIGVTGMLGEMLNWLAVRSERVVLVSRGAVQSASAAHNTVIPVSADWRNEVNFIDSIEAANGFSGVKLAVVWMHDTGADAKRRVLERLAEESCLVVDVLGSSALKDLKQMEPQSDYLGPQARRVTVLLGAMPTGAGHRWLEWSEISQAVIWAVENRVGLTVGELP